MWLLALDDKLYWLLVGKKYTIGRASNHANSDLDLVVTGDASVSRKHVTLEIRSVSENAVLHPSIRSEILVTDLGSRFGTKVDGEQLPSGTSAPVPYVPSGMSSIKLGRATKLRLKWHSFVVTYSTGQQGSAHETLWQHALDLLRPLDIKLMPYIVKSTDIFVKTGKYTSSLYYALTKQIPIVNNHYFEALRNAAAVCSTKGTLDQSVIPDTKPFLPEPSWEPNPKRAACLTGTVFYLPDSKHAEALRPVLEAAGAQCTQNPGIVTAIALYSLESEAKSAKPGRFVMESAVFQAIVEARPLKSGDIRQSLEDRPTEPVAPYNSPSRKRHILDIMTSQEQHHSMPQPSVVPAEKKTKTEPRVLEGVDNKHPPSQDMTFKQRHTQNNRPETSQEDNSMKTADSRPLKPASRKRKPTDLDEAPASKIAGTTEDMLQGQHEQHDKSQNQDDESDMSPVDYEKIGELAIVETTLDLYALKPTTMSGSEVERPEWQGRQNFKAFGTVPRQTARRVEYDEDISSTKFDYDDFEVGDRKEPDVANDSILSLAQVTSNTKQQPPPGGTSQSEEEEQLFVNSDIEASDPAFESDASFSEKTPSVGRRIAQEDQSGDDFGFSFS